ncbi:6-phosphogluconolactonase [Ferruginibacter albus]|uniref:6-phosphogluconolactonase n=1 Tax=Ferruginibacter albus TaxID=2875540 RepID=UPI001CC73FFA|nr:6-phosphogluconolactonase [Ferruginibacter albus]UAY52209.1 6-phosphogluconolactonase [Ferruginibacter albus]
MNSTYSLQIFDADDFFTATANFIVDIAGKAIAKNGRFTIALSGGNTPEKLFSLLAEKSFADKIDWNKTFVFWGDERCVPGDDKLNNARMAKTLLLDKINIPAANVFAIDTTLSPKDAAIDYEKKIKRLFGKGFPSFDLILLGLGTNGHTASLFPDTDILYEKEHLVKEVYVEEQKMFRVTMTAPLINAAQNIMFLVTGRSKEQILHTVLTSRYQPDKYPAQLIKPATGKLFWFADKDAATL